MHTSHFTSYAEHSTDDAVHLSGRVVAFGSMGLSSVWSVMLSIGSHGPEWSQVPPILIAIASLVATINVARNDALKRRLAENPPPNPGLGMTTRTVATTTTPASPPSTTTTTATTTVGPTPPVGPVPFKPSVGPVEIR